MPTTTTTTRRLPIDPAIDRAIDTAFVAGGYAAAASAAQLALGWVPTRSQLDIAIGRHAWLVGETRGDQGYQRRMAAAGRAMPRIAPTARTAARPAPTSAGRYPASIDRAFGVELEFNRGGGSYDQQRDIVRAMVAAGHAAEVQGYNHVTPTCWKMITDATVTGGEFVSPILTGEAGLNAMRDAVRAIKGNGGAAGRSQGLHVHHDIRDHDAADMRRLVRNLRFAERAMLAYVPRYRYDGSGSCRANVVPSHQWAQYEQSVADGHLLPANRGQRRGVWNRYVSTNFNPTLAYGTVELRALGNTLNPVKVRTWIRVGQALIAFGKAGGELTEFVGAEELVDLLAREGHLEAAEAARFVEVCEARREGRRAA